MSLLFIIASIEGEILQDHLDATVESELRSAYHEGIMSDHGKSEVTTDYPIEGTEVDENSNQHDSVEELSLSDHSADHTEATTFEEEQQATEYVEPTMTPDVYNQYENEPIAQASPYDLAAADFSADSVQANTYENEPIRFDSPHVPIEVATIEDEQQTNEILENTLASDLSADPIHTATFENERQPYEYVETRIDSEVHNQFENEPIRSISPQHASEINADFPEDIRDEIDPVTYQVPEDTMVFDHTAVSIETATFENEPQTNEVLEDTHETEILNAQIGTSEIENDLNTHDFVEEMAPSQFSADPIDDTIDDVQSNTHISPGDEMTPDIYATPVEITTFENELQTDQYVESTVATDVHSEFESEPIAQVFSDDAVADADFSADPIETGTIEIHPVTFDAAEDTMVFDHSDVPMEDANFENEQQADESLENTFAAPVIDNEPITHDAVEDAMTNDPSTDSTVGATFENEQQTGEYLDPITDSEVYNHFEDEPMHQNEPVLATINENKRSAHDCPEGTISLACSTAPETASEIENGQCTEDKEDCAAASDVSRTISVATIINEPDSAEFEEAAATSQRDSSDDRNDLSASELEATEDELELSLAHHSARTGRGRNKASAESKYDNTGTRQSFNISYLIIAIVTIIVNF